MKVLQVNAVYKSGSTGRNIFELKNAMAEQGIDTYIASTCMNERSKDCYQIGCKLDWKNHALLSRITGLQGYYSYWSTRKFLKYMDKIQPDIVHLNNLHANYINLRMLFKYLSSKDIPTVITLHDCWFYTGKCTHYTTQRCERWKTGCCKCPKLKTDNVSWLFDRTKKMWSDKQFWFGQLKNYAVIGVSDWITEEARKSILKDAKIIRRIYNWIDLDLLKKTSTDELKKKLGLENKYVILGVASCWANSKGLQEFYQLSSQLSSDEVIVLVGKLPKNQVSKDGLPANILHISATENVSELVSYYSLADVFLQLSKEETFGKVVAESLACGTPVITINSTANKELVPDRCGIVIQDIRELYKAYKEIKRNGKHFYSEQCRKFAEENFKMEDRSVDYVKVYKDLIHSNNT